MIFIITAFTDYSIIKINKKLKSNNILSKMIPPPRQISSECGMALQLDIDDKNNLLKLLNEIKDDIDKIYYEENKNFIEFWR